MEGESSRWTLQPGLWEHVTQLCRWTMHTHKLLRGWRHPARSTSGAFTRTHHVLQNERYSTCTQSQRKTILENAGPLSLPMRIPQLPQEISTGHIWLSQSHDPTSLPTLFPLPGMYFLCLFALQIPVSLSRLSSHIIWTLLSPQHHRRHRAPLFF